MRRHTGLTLYHLDADMSVPGFKINSPKDYVTGEEALCVVQVAAQIHQVLPTKHKPANDMEKLFILKDTAVPRNLQIPDKKTMCTCTRQLLS